jgi:hypothetical protein
MATLVPSSYYAGPTGVNIANGTYCVVRRGIYIVSSDDVGILCSGLTKLQVFGEVFGRKTGVYLGRNNFPDFDVLTVSADGTVSSTQTGVVLLGANCRIYNGGEIFGLDKGVYFQTFIEKSSLIIKNSGKIFSDDVAIYCDNSSAKFNINNLNDITAPTVLDSFAAGAHKIVNRGSMNGDLIIHSADSAIRNRGLIAGDVTLSGNVNIFDDRGGTIDGTLTFAAGNDTFQPGISIEVVYGGAGAIRSISLSPASSRSRSMRASLPRARQRTILTRALKTSSDRNPAAMC